MDKPETEPKYRRILLKLSGEALMGQKAFGIDEETIGEVARQIKCVHDLGVAVGVVIGAGNIFRGMAASAAGMNRAKADYMGMLGTVMNSIALEDHLTRQEVPTTVLTALDMPRVAESFSYRRAMEALDRQNVVIFAAGTGNPYFTTDTAAALRAVEIGADVIMKATKVDGIYTADPVTDPAAVKLDKVAYMEVLEKRLKVMDATAFSLCMDNAMPILVFNLKRKNNIINAVCGLAAGTIVED